MSSQVKQETRLKLAFPFLISSAWVILSLYISDSKAVNQKPTESYAGQCLGNAVFPLAALWGWHTPVIHIRQTQFDFLLTEPAIPLQRLVFLQHVLQALFMCHQVFVVAPTWFIFCVKAWVVCPPDIYWSQPGAQWHVLTLPGFEVTCIKMNIMN